MRVGIALTLGRTSRTLIVFSTDRPTFSEVAGTNLLTLTSIAKMLRGLGIDFSHAELECIVLDLEELSRKLGRYISITEFKGILTRLVENISRHPNEWRNITWSNDHEHYALFFKTAALEYFLPDDVVVTVEGRKKFSDKLWLKRYVRELTRIHSMLPRIRVPHIYRTEVVIGNGIFFALQIDSMRATPIMNLNMLERVRRELERLRVIPSSFYVKKSLLRAFKRRMTESPDLIPRLVVAFPYINDLYSEAPIYSEEEVVEAVVRMTRNWEEFLRMIQNLYQKFRDADDRSEFAKSVMRFIVERSDLSFLV